MEPILKTATHFDWITITIFSSLIFLVIAKNFFYNRFVNFIILPFNNKYLFMYNKKDKLLNWFHIFFTVFQLLNFALFLYLTQPILLPDIPDNLNFLYLIIFAVLLLVLALKIALQLGNGFIFGINKVIGDFIFKKLSYLNYSSIVAFIANVLLTFIFIDSKITIYTALMLILFINGIGWLTILRNYQKFIAGNFFYFILYLCALEIAPFVIIGSYLKD